MNDLFTKYPNAGAGGDLARQQAIDRVKTNIEWVTTRAPSLNNALNTFF